MRIIFALLLALLSTINHAQSIDSSGLRVAGRFIVNGAGEAVHIHGGNRADPTFCGNPNNTGHTQPNGVRANLEPAYQIRQRDQWHINAVRIMVNEWCWQRNMVKEGITYQAAIAELVTSLTSNNMVAIISLAIVQDQVPTATNVPSIQYGTPALAMPNRQNSIIVWQQMANLWKTNSRVIFNLYNEPTPYLCHNSGDLPRCSPSTGSFLSDETKAWQCLRNGGIACTGNGSNGSFTIPAPVMGSNAVGMQELVDVIRATGANNVISVPGIGYSGNLKRWIEFKPNDPEENNLIAAGHYYRFNQDNGTCPGGVAGTATNPTGCRSALESNIRVNGTGALVGDTFPIIYEEFGTQSATDTAEGSAPCADQLFIPFLVNYAREKQQGYMFHSTWQRNPFGADPGPCKFFYTFVNITTTTLEATRYGLPYKTLVAQVPSWSYGFVGGGTDTTPDAFSFTGVTNVALSSTQTSNTVTISGINAPASISVSGGSYSIGCTATFTMSPATISNGQNVCVRHTASASHSTTVMTTLTIGGVAGSFSSTTLAAGGSDTTPDEYSFDSINNVPAGSGQVSNFVTITGINTPSPISVSAPSTYSINNGMFGGGAGNITNGQNVRVAHFASTSPSSTTTTTLDIGGVMRGFSSTTAAAPGADTTPNPFSLNSASNVALNSGQGSNFLTITGITAPAPISVSGGSSYSINGGGFVLTPGTIANNAIVQVAHFAAGTNSTTVTTVLNIGGATSRFSTTTLAAAGSDTTPNDFSFASTNGVPLNSQQASGFATITGINTPALISVSDGSSYSINGGAFGATPGTINNNDVVQVAHFAAGTNSTTRTTTLNIGGTIRSFSTTTVP